MTERDPRVSALLRAMTALAAGRFDAPLPAVDSDEPLDRVVEGFAAMRDVLATRESSMRQTEQLTVLLQDVSAQLAMSRKQLARQAEQDPLTELGNRRALLTSSVRARTRPLTPCCIARTSPCTRPRPPVGPGRSSTWRRGPRSRPRGRSPASRVPHRPAPRPPRSEAPPRPAAPPPALARPATVCEGRRPSGGPVDSLTRCSKRSPTWIRAGATRWCRPYSASPIGPEPRPPNRPRRSIE